MKFKKRIYLLLVLMLLCISSVIVSAEDGYVTVEDSYTIVIPKNLNMSITLNREGTYTYNVYVKGTLNENVCVSVTPDFTFVMEQVNTHEKLTATVTQEKTEWYSSDLSDSYSVSSGDVSDGGL